MNWKQCNKYHEYELHNEIRNSAIDKWIQGAQLNWKQCDGYNEFGLH